MPTDLPPDYKPQPAPSPDTPQGRPVDGTPPAPGKDSPLPPGLVPPPGSDVSDPLPASVPGTPAGLPTF